MKNRSILMGKVGQRLRIATAARVVLEGAGRMKSTVARFLSRGLSQRIGVGKFIGRSVRSWFSGPQGVQLFADGLQGEWQKGRRRQ